jgi:dihydrofolate reductase
MIGGMRQLRYSVASSLDGYIAGPNGEYDWIVADPEIDFAAMYASFSALVMGRHSYDVFVATGGAVGPALPTYVYSRTLPEGEHNGVTIVRDPIPHLRALKTASVGPHERDASGKEKPIWLWGGGQLFHQLAEAGLVDGVDVGLIPILLGGGLPLMPTPGPRLRLALRRHRLYAASSTMMLEYDVVYGSA